MQAATTPTRTTAPRSGRAVSFEHVKGPRPADGIQSQIRTAVSSRRLRAGDRLPSERELAEQFGVSRNSVRQALRSLVDSGLLEMKKGATGGAFIRNGGGDAVRAGFVDLYSLGTIQPSHLTETRILIGVEVVRLACERGTDEEFEALERNVEAAEEAVRAGDERLRTHINLQFYRLLAAMTHNPLLEIVTDSVMAITQKFVEDFLRTSTPTVMPFRHKLLAELRARDADAAAKRMREHLLGLQKIYLAEAGQRAAETSPAHKKLVGTRNRSRSS